MITYVNTVLVSNLGNDSAGVIDEAPKDWNGGTNYDKNLPSANAGMFIFMNCDPNVASTKLYDVASNAATINTIKVGIVTKKNNAVPLQDGTIKYIPIIKWSNEIKAADIKSYVFHEWEADTEDTVYIDLSGMTEDKLVGVGKEPGKRIVVRLTFKDLPNRYRKWTESYEYVTKAGETKASIAGAIATMINKEWKRARVHATQGTYTPAAGATPASFTPGTSGEFVQIVALPYDDDDSNESLNWANKVRFNANIYWTDPAGDGWESLNKNFPDGVKLSKEPGKTYVASGKLVRDHESKAQGYLGILNRGEGTWPIIKPAIEANINAHYDAITLEFENMYRAADDIFRKTKQTVEIYGLTEQLADVKDILDDFVGGTQQDENVMEVAA